MTIDRSAADRYRPSIQRRDRRWELHAGGRRFAIVFSDCRTSAPVATFQLLRRTGSVRTSGLPSITKVVGLVLGLLGGVATVGIAIQSGRANAGSASYVVSVPVPERPVAATSARPTRRAPLPQATVSAATAAPIARATATPVPFYTDEIVDRPAQLASRQAATAAAMKSGDLQQWADASGEERGFVVAGPVQDGCRDLSILIRRFGVDDRVERRRDCTRVATN